jgi:pimeloyl-[acyl-carrier protein] methyl ester esterase
MPFLTLGGATLRYDRAGTGPTVLLIHGWLGNRSFWERQVMALRDRFTVVTVDLRGHGESSPPRVGYTVGGMAADLEQLVRAIGAQKVALVGWSMGGMIAQELARRLGDRVSALVLVGTTAGALADPKNPHANPALATEIQAAVNADFRAFVRSFATTIFKAGSASPLVAWTTSQMLRTPPHAAQACIENILAVDHDQQFPVAMAEELKKGIKGAQLVLFEESAHSPHLEEPDRFNEVVGAFLGSGTGAAAAQPAAPKAAPAPAAPKAAPPKPVAAPPARKAEAKTAKPVAKKPAPAPKKPDKKAAKASGAKKPAKKKR